MSWSNFFAIGAGTNEPLPSGYANPFQVGLPRKQGSSINTYYFNSPSDYNIPGFLQNIPHTNAFTLDHYGDVDFTPAIASGIGQGIKFQWDGGSSKLEFVLDVVHFTGAVWLPGSPVIHQESGNGTGYVIATDGSNDIPWWLAIDYSTDPADTSNYPNLNYTNAFKQQIAVWDSTNPGGIPETNAGSMVISNAFAGTYFNYPMDSATVSDANADGVGSNRNSPVGGGWIYRHIGGISLPSNVTAIRFYMWSGVDTTPVDQIKSYALWKEINPDYIPMAIRKSGNWKALNQHSGFIKRRESGSWVDYSHEDISTSEQPNQGHNRIRKSGVWLQLPPMKDS